MSGSIETVLTNNTFYTIDATPGNSGSGVYNNSNQIVAVHAYGTTALNFGTRINSEKFNVVNSWINRTGALYTKDIVVSGDFNGDGMTDMCKIVGVRDATGQKDQIEFHVTLNGLDTTTVWRTATSYNIQKIIGRAAAGDFNGDGKCDIAVMCKYDDAPMQVHVFTSTGSSFNNCKTWCAATTYGNYDADKVTGRFAAGDFNGDGKCDIAVMYKPDTAPIIIQTFVSTGSSFNCQAWYNGATIAGYDANKVTGRFVAGDFNGDGKCDIAAMYKYAASPMQVHVFTSTGSSFNGWKTWCAATTYGNYDADKVTGRFAAGDFNGDGKCDIAAMYNPDTAPIIIQTFVSTGSAFNCQSWYTEPTIELYNANRINGFVTGYFNRNASGKADVVANYNNYEGYPSYQYFKSTGTAFSRWLNWP